MWKHRQITLASMFKNSARNDKKEKDKKSVITLTFSRLNTFLKLHPAKFSGNKSCASSNSHMI